MRVKAAVLYGPGTKYQVEEVTLDPPKENEVLVRYAASGMCHSDACGSCPSCVTGHQNLCDLGNNLLSGRMADGTSRFRTASGDDCATMCALGTFAEYGVLGTASLVKIPRHLPLDKAALVACGVTLASGRRCARPTSSPARRSS